jgi:isocitrate/isopropylmalate dehydrogenase
MHQHLSPPSEGSEEKPINEIHYRTISRGRNWTRGNNAVKVSDAIAKKFNHEIIWTPALTGACAIDAVGVPYPDETHEICMKADAVLFGAIGHPKYDNDPTAKVRPEQGLLLMRKISLFANVRPTLRSLFNR